MESTKLEYATDRGRSKKRLVVGSAFLLVGVVTLMNVVPTVEYIWQFRLPLLSAQRQCLIFSNPAGKVVYEEEPAAANKLAGGKIQGPGWATLSDKGAIEGYYSVWPECMKTLWSDPNFTRTGFIADPYTCVFTHGRTAAGATQRLIFVGVKNSFALRQGLPIWNNWAGDQSVLKWMVASEGTLRAAAVPLAQGTFSDADFRTGMRWPLRIYAGAGDAKDAAHFVIPYRTPAGTFALDGWLQANDQLTFARRYSLPSDGPMP